MKHTGEQGFRTAIEGLFSMHKVQCLIPSTQGEAGELGKCQREEGRKKEKKMKDRREGGERERGKEGGTEGRKEEISNLGQMAN